jgi:phospholipid/cholesterol/gamma-HCH transport system substrate-binding protein
MRTGPRTLRVGALTVFALAILAVGTFLVGREQRLWERKIDYEIRFQRANGLRRGSPVSLSGVDIGSVQDVSFPSDPSQDFISVRIRVADAAARRIRASTVARILTQGILGDKYVELSPGSSLEAPLPPGSVIPSEDPIDYEKLLGRGGDIVSNIVEASNSLKNVFGAIDRGEGLLGRMLRDEERAAAFLSRIEETLGHLSATSASVERIVRDVEAGKGAFGALLRHGDEIERALVRLDRTSAALERFVSRLEQAEGTLPRLLEDEEYARGLLADLRSAVADLAAVAEKANRGEGSLGRLVNDPRLYENANEFVTSTRRSWLFGVYRGLRGLFPPYAPPLEAASCPPPAPATPRP